MLLAVEFEFVGVGFGAAVTDERREAVVREEAAAFRSWESVAVKARCLILEILRGRLLVECCPNGDSGGTGARAGAGTPEGAGPGTDSGRTADGAAPWPPLLVIACASAREKPSESC